MALRPPAQYLHQYNTEATKYLNFADRYIDGVQKGTYALNGGILSLLFCFCEYSINIQQTDDDTAQQVLDKIIILV